MTVAAPGRLSITTGWPSASLIRGASRRATTSDPPPGGYGTISRTGRSGKILSTALAANAMNGAKAATAAILENAAISRTQILHMGRDLSPHTLQLVSNQCAATGLYSPQEENSPCTAY